MSYLRSWFSLDTSSSATKVEPNSSYPNQSLPVPEFNEEDEDDGSDTAGEDDAPPAFPAINSPSRRLSIPKILTDSALMPPPPVPSLATRQPGVPPPQGNVRS
ncbi:hypothetical protein EV702DRAFT_1195483 [Suillus placidus]|uniref:Uncharacterized protein n=1 Tax=Suillus placidus TaxID=48579 RepID=A0A9P6ZY33_9AGAM|nr:hypothetical protein EV702DRAFT_1195483 [Suillus placidus]